MPLTFGAFVPRNPTSSSARLSVAGGPTFQSLTEFLRLLEFRGLLGYVRVHPALLLIPRAIRNLAAARGDHRYRSPAAASSDATVVPSKGHRLTEAVLGAGRAAAASAGSRAASSGGGLRFAGRSSVLVTQRDVDAVLSALDLPSLAPVALRELLGKVAERHLVHDPLPASNPWATYVRECCQRGGGGGGASSSTQGRGTATLGASSRTGAPRGRFTDLFAPAVLPSSSSRRESRASGGTMPSSSGGAADAAAMNATPSSAEIIAGGNPLPTVSRAVGQEGTPAAMVLPRGGGNGDALTPNACADHLGLLLPTPSASQSRRSSSSARRTPMSQPPRARGSETTTTPPKRPQPHHYVSASSASTRRLGRQPDPQQALGAPPHSSTVTAAQAAPLLLGSQATAASSTPFRQQQPQQGLVDLAWQQPHVLYHLCVLAAADYERLAGPYHMMVDVGMAVEAFNPELEDAIDNLQGQWEDV